MAMAIGDFPGLIQKLDYIQSLGVNALWLLPFYPSPLRDDGYDIAEYEAVHPQYGTLEDFQRLLDEAHAREHPRHHRARHQPHLRPAPVVPARARRAARVAGAQLVRVVRRSAPKYKDARIIFTDTEVSNWTWDPVAEQFYWHRFFSHQPDLNFDNPRGARGGDRA